MQTYIYSRQLQWQTKLSGKQTWEVSDMFEVEDLLEKASFPGFGMEEVERFGLLFRNAEKNS